MHINSNKPFKKERWDGVLKRSQRENSRVEQECITFLVTRVRSDKNKSSGAANLSSIPNPSRPRRFYPSHLTLQIYTIILLSTEASVFTSIKQLTCFQFEFPVVFNKAIIKVSIDLLYLYISIYIHERLITVVQTERNSTKTSLKNTARELLPERQIFPSPQYPCLHVQLYDPLVLLHTASALQSVFPIAHSSISEKTLL